MNRRAPLPHPEKPSQSQKALTTILVEVGLWLQIQSLWTEIVMFNSLYGETVSFEKPAKTQENPVKTTKSENQERVNPCGEERTGEKRFTTVDPIQDGNNWYAYVNNDPVNFTDPDGLRDLTAQEIAAAQEVFGDKIDYSKVKIITGTEMNLMGTILTGPSNAAVTLGDTIYFPNKPGTTESQYSFETQEPWLMHEMTHEFQYQSSGWGYAAQSVIEQTTQGKDAYKLTVDPNKTFDQYGIEQQAVLVQDYSAGWLSKADAEIVKQTLEAKGLLPNPKKGG